MIAYIALACNAPRGKNSLDGYYNVVFVWSVDGEKKCLDDGKIHIMMLSYGML